MSIEEGCQPWFLSPSTVHRHKWRKKRTVRFYGSKLSWVSRDERGWKKKVFLTQRKEKTAPCPTVRLPSILWSVTQIQKYLKHSSFFSLPRRFFDCDHVMKYRFVADVIALLAFVVAYVKINQMHYDEINSFMTESIKVIM